MATNKGGHMKPIRSRVSTLLLIATCAVCGSSYVQAQDVVLDVKTTVGTSSPVSGQHTVAAGSEVALHTGSIYRVVAVPTVLPSGQVQLAVKVFDATSTSSAPVSSPTMIIAQGQEATMAQGTEPPNAKNLKLQVTPRLK